jgi:DNA replication protein DnaC
MPFKIFVPESFDCFAGQGEQQMTLEVVNVLKNLYAEENPFCILFLSYNCPTITGDRQIDVTVFTENKIINVELKNYSGQLETRPNGKWLIDGKVIECSGGPNPKDQVRSQNYSLKNYLKTNSKTLTGDENRYQDMGIAGCVVFKKLAPSNSKLNEYYVKITDLENFVNTSSSIEVPAFKDGTTKPLLNIDEISNIGSKLTLVETSLDKLKAIVSKNPFEKYLLSVATQSTSKLLPREEILKNVLAIQKDKIGFLIGVAGTGKSTLLTLLAIKLAKIFMEGPTGNNKIPFIIKPSLFYSPELIRSIKNAIQTDGNPKENGFERCLKNGEFFFLIDGIDEIYLQGGKKDIYTIKNFIQNYRKSSFLLTCRSQDYNNISELFKEEPKIDIDNKYLEGLSLKQAKDYLKLLGVDAYYIDRKWQAIEQLLNIIGYEPLSIYLLSDLLKEKDHEEYLYYLKSEYEFYQKYFQRFIFREIKKIGLPSGIEVDTILWNKDLKTIAYERFKNGETEFSTESVLVHVSENLLVYFKSSGILKEEVVEYRSLEDTLALSKRITLDPEIDVKIMKKITKTKVVLSFKHKKYQEYFAAEYLKDICSNDDLNLDDYVSESWVPSLIFLSQASSDTLKEKIILHFIENNTVISLDIQWSTEYLTHNVTIIQSIIDNLFSYDSTKFHRLMDVIRKHKLHSYQLWKKLAGISIKERYECFNIFKAGYDCGFDINEPYMLNSFSYHYYSNEDKFWLSDVDDLMSSKNNKHLFSSIAEDGRCVWKESGRELFERLIADMNWKNFENILLDKSVDWEFKFAITANLREYFDESPSVEPFIWDDGGKRDASVVINDFLDNNIAKLFSNIKRDDVGYETLTLANIVSLCNPGEWYFTIIKSKHLLQKIVDLVIETENPFLVYIILGNHSFSLEEEYRAEYKSVYTEFIYSVIDKCNSQEKVSMGFFKQFAQNDIFNNILPGWWGDMKFYIQWEKPLYEYYKLEDFEGETDSILLHCLALSRLARCDNSAKAKILFENYANSENIKIRTVANYILDNYVDNKSEK